MPAKAFSHQENNYFVYSLILGGEFYILMQ